MRSSIAVAALWCVCLAASAGRAEVLKSTTVGSPEFKSINVLAFAPEGVLLIGDGRGAQIFAVDTGDVSPTKHTLKGKIDAIDAKLAARLGAKPNGITIIDMAVNPASGVTYFAVRKQDDKTHVILTVDGEGKIDELNLDVIKYARVALQAGDSRVNVVTDIAWADDRLVAAGRSNEEFASKIFSVSAPLSHDGKSVAHSAETYHISHRRWETKAPMSVVIPFKEKGKTYIVGAFSCTPIVKYPVDSLKPGSKVKGVSMIELGSGNRPIDMFVYQKKGKTYVLSNTFRFHHERKPFGPSPYWTVKFEQGLLAGDENVNEKAARRLKGYEPNNDRIEMVESFHGVTQMDKLGEEQVVTLRKGKSGLSLEVLPLP